jgi:dipeptidyl aminopeptidase/acylaminoacyl peptidase
MHGEKDQLVPYQQAIDLYDRLRSVGVEAALLPVTNSAHGFAKLKPWTRPMVCRAMYDFFSERL